MNTVSRELAVGWPVRIVPLMLSFVLKQSK